MLAAIRAIHSAIYLAMAWSVLYILFCGIAGRSGTLLAIALVLVGVECVVFIGNGMKCPLSKLATDYGAKEATFTDTFLPERFTRYTAPVFGTLLVVGILLLAIRQF